MAVPGSTEASWPFEELERPESDPVLRALAELAPRSEPPASLRQRVMARFRAEHGAGAAAADRDGILTVRAGAGGWTESRAPGVWFRVLSRDDAARRRTMLVRMDPGTSYPPHVHAGDEECLVLEGDLRVTADVHMRSGDYQLARAGSRHGPQSTVGGCLLLIRDSLEDVLEVA